MATYKFIREEVVQGVFRSASSQPRTTFVPPPLDRIRAQFDAAFMAINSQVSEAFAGKESNRELLRVSQDVAFLAGDGTLPSNVLKKFIEDATFFVSGTPVKHYSFRRFPDFLRGGDTRLGLWTQVGDTIKAKTPAPVIPFVGTATVTTISSPAIPATEDDEFDCPDDYVPDFIAAMTQFILGQTMDNAAATS